MVDEASLSEEDLDAYDIWTGEITCALKSTDSIPARRHINLFGGGIAFPQFYQDEEGDQEPWIGVKRSMFQAHLMIKAYEAYNR